MYSEKEPIDWDLVPAILSKALKLMNQKATISLKPYGLTSAHAMFLIVLAKNDGLTLRELSDIVYVDKAQTTRIIGDLEAKKYTFSDKENECSRNYKIFLTKEGKTAAKYIKTELAELRKNMIITCIDKNEEEIFLKTISKIIACVKSNDIAFQNGKEVIK